MQRIFQTQLALKHCFTFDNQNLPSYFVDLLLVIVYDHYICLMNLMHNNMEHVLNFYKIKYQLCDLDGNQRGPYCTCVSSYSPVGLLSQHQDINE